jgi:hypothetical protein
MENWRPENPEEAILSTCSTLISVIEDESSRIIQFSHFSVKEFLTSDRLRTSDIASDYYIPLDSAHTILARACLAVLLQLDDTVDKERLKMFPLAIYAAQRWVDHAKYEGVESRVQEAMKELFNPKKSYLASWIWIHDIVDGWYRESIDDLGERSSLPERTPLYCAAYCGFSGVTNYLIVAHAEDINAQVHKWGAPLHTASHNGHTEAISVLFENNANLNARSATYYDWTPLHFASNQGHAKVVQFLLENGADLNAQSTSQSTPLKWASEWGRLEVVRILLQHGADVHIRDERGKTALQRATHYGHVRIVQLLSEHGADKI